jgi:hypothetical protein
MQVLFTFSRIVHDTFGTYKLIFRLLTLYLSKRDPKEFARKKYESSSFEILLSKNGLYNLVRRLCVAINQPSLHPQYLDVAIPSIVFLIRAMAYNPELCGKDDNDVDGVDSDNDTKTDQRRKKKKSESESSLDGARWPMQRLAAIGTDMRGKRRLFVLQV